MHNLNPFSTDELSKGIAVLKDKRKTLYLLSLICNIMVTPLAIKNLIIGHYILGFFLLAFTSTVAINTFSLWAFEKYPFNRHILISLLIVSLLLTIADIGISGVFWIFPATVSFLFVLPTKEAIAYNSILCIGSAITCIYTMELSVALRAIVTLSCTCIISYLILSSLKALQKQIKEEASKDPLTGLLNRRQLDYYIQNSIAQFQRHATKTALLMIDIDHFKKVNDQYGHEAGDKVLIQCSTVLKQNVRETDFVFRLGGEEFLILARLDNDDAANTLAEKIRDCVSKETIIENHPITVSVGVCMINHKIDNDSWLKHTDKALYRAKNTGRNRVEHHLST